MSNIVYQKTIVNPVEFSGIGVHSGKIVNIKIFPSDKGGIVFKNGNNTIEALYSNVVDTQMGTTIANQNIKVATMEHLMSAIYACDLDNLLIEIDSVEVPIMDGSAKNFIDEIKKAGVKQLNTERKFIELKDKIEVKDGDKFIVAEPQDFLSIDLSIDFKYGNIGKQHYSWSEKDNNFELFSCRTICNIKEIEYLWSIGLAKGGSFDNSMIFNDTGLINRADYIKYVESKNLDENFKKYLLDVKEKDGFRCENEVVKHKMLDLIGDLFSAGHYIKAKITANKTGHTLNNMFVKELYNGNILV